MLYDSCVSSVSDYSAALTGFSDYECLTKIQLRAIRAFLGLPKNAPNAGVLSEVKWLLPKFRTQIPIIRHYHRLLNMDNSRITKMIFLWDKDLNQRNIISTWHNEVGSILRECNLALLFEMGVSFDMKFTINYMKLKLFKCQASSLSVQCSTLPKLRTFVTFKDFNQEAFYVKKHLNFFSRRFLARLRLGCLPLRLETGRYSVPRLPEERRTCQICETDTERPEIESEIHFLFSCKAYKDERDRWMQAMTLPLNFESLANDEKLKIILNDSCNVKPTATFIDQSLSVRDRLLSVI